MQVQEQIPVIEKIHSTGYWRVNIRPTVFNATLIPNLTKCQELIRDCQVRLRGWYYPHISHEGMLSGQDWTESSTDREDHIEYWRFYQSGQFVHHFALREDYSFSGEKVLRIRTTLFLLTEIFEFASRLTEKGILSPSAEIQIELHGMKDRRLNDPDRIDIFDYVSGIDTVSIKKVVASDTLLAQSHELALDTTIEILERFNLTGASRATFAEDQRRLLERRL